jgi:hypothetical protein
MPLLTVPHEIVARVLLALSPDYKALCRVAQTCAVLRDMEAVEREVLWKRIREALIPLKLPATSRWRRWRDFQPLDLGEKTQSLLHMDDKTVVRASFAQGPFDLDYGSFRHRLGQNAIQGTKEAPKEPDPTFTVKAFEEQFEVVIEFQFTDPRNNFSAPLEIRKTTEQQVLDCFVTLGGHDRMLTPSEVLEVPTEFMEWVTPQGWSSPIAMSYERMPFDEMLRAAILVRDRTKNAVSILTIANSPTLAEEFDVGQNKDMCNFEFVTCSRAWKTAWDQPAEMQVFADRNDDRILSLQIWLTSSRHKNDFIYLCDLASAVRSNDASWVPCP